MLDPRQVAKAGESIGYFGSLHKKIKKAVQTGPLKNFRSFKRGVERKKQGAVVFDAVEMRSDMLSSIISPAPFSRSISPMDDSFAGFDPIGSRAYACMSPDDDLDIRHMSNSRCSTTTPAASPDVWAGSNESVCSRPGTRQGMRSNNDSYRALDTEKHEIDECQFVDIVVREKVKADYWETHKEVDSAKKVISDWEEYMRKIHDEIGDEEILDKDLISSFSGFTVKTPQEQVISAYARQCQKSYYIPLGPRSRKAPQGTCTPLMTTPEILQYSGWSLGSDRLDMILDTSGQSLRGCRHCNLSGNRISNRSIPVLCSQLLPTVETLDLSNNLLTGEGARNLAVGFKACKRLPARAPLLELNLEENRLGEGKEEDVCQLVENLGAFCPQLRGLSLAKNNLGLPKHDPKKAVHEGGGVGGALGRFISSASTLRVLDLHWNQFGGVGAYQLLTGIYDNGQQSDGRLSRVDLSWNRLGVVDPAHKNAVPAKVLADVLEDHKHLFHLDISYNQLGVEACEFIAAGIKNNHTLFGIHIAGNAASVDANGFIFPHKQPGSIRPPLIDEYALSCTSLEDAKKSRKSLGRFGSSASVNSKSSKFSMTKRRCTQFIETEQGITTDASMHSVDLASDIGSHSVDYLHIRAECCWICDRWKPTRLVWTPGVSGPIVGDDVKGVFAFLSIDGFRRPMPLQRKTHTRSRETWEGFFMLPPTKRLAPLLVIFQVNDSIELAADMPKRTLADPVCISQTTGGKQEVSVPTRSYSDDNRCKLRCGRRARVTIGEDEEEICGICCEGCASGKEHSEDCLGGSEDFMYEANELPPIPLNDKSPESRQKPPLVITEDHVEHGKLLVLPRSVNLEGAKIVKKWTKAVSVWSTWMEEMTTHLDKMLEADLQLAKVSKIGSPPDKDLKKSILPYYAMIMSAYRILSTQDRTGWMAFGINLTNFVALCNKCELLDESLSSKDLSSFTVASGVVEKRNLQTVRVRGDHVNIRYQFMETLLRIAHTKYVVPNHVATLGKGMDWLLHDMKEHLSEYRTDLEKFRRLYFIEEVDMVYKAYIHFLRAVYDHYASMNHRPQSMGALGLPDWCQLLHDCDAFDEKFVRRKAPTAFLYGLMWQIDEVSNERFMHMSFVEFLVGIGAVVYLRMFWHKEEFADLVEEFFEDHLVPAMESKFAEQNEKISTLLGKAHDVSSRPVALSKKQLEKAFHTVFEIADEDDDGELTLREFRNAFRNPKVVHILGGKNCSADDFGRVFDSLDLDHNHVLTLDEAILGFDSFRRLELTSDRAIAYFTNFCNELMHIIDGTIRRAELAQALRRPSVLRKLMRLSIDSDHVSQFLNQAAFDENDGFEVDWVVEELLKLRSAKIIPRWKIAIRQIFQEGDQNGNESVSKREWKKMLDSPSIVSKLEKCGIPRPMMEPMFDSCDADGDNELTIQELIDGIELVVERGMAVALPGQPDDVSSKKGNKNANVGGPPPAAPQKASPTPAGKSKKDKLKEPSAQHAQLSSPKHHP